MEKITKVILLLIFIALPLSYASGDFAYNRLGPDLLASISCDLEGCTIDGDLDVTGNFTGDMYYGEMWNYTSAGYNFDIDAADVYYNLTGLTAGNLNGFRFQSNSSDTGGDHLVTEVSGLYRVSLSMSFGSQAQGGTYGISLNHGWNPNTHRNCYARRTASSDTGNIALQCLMDLEVGDPIAVMVENEATNRDMTIYTVNINVVRVGDM